MRLPRAAWWFCVCVVAFAGCKRDNFRCGIDEGTRKPTQCDGTNEVCICDVNRCAVPSTSCESRWQWKFGEGEECVGPAQLTSKIVSDNTTFCPGLATRPTECGVPNADGSTFVACGSAQLCLCGPRDSAVTLATPGHSCVALEPTCERSELRRAFDNTCVDAERSDLVLRSAVDGWACPGSQIIPPTCGISSAQANVPCGEGRLCLCGLSDGGAPSLPRYSCVQPEPACTETHLRDRDGRCLTGAPLEAHVLVFPDAGLDCPGFDLEQFRPRVDAGVDAGLDAGQPPATCGIPGVPSSETCTGFEACFCGTADAGVNESRYACVRAWAPCRDDGGVGLQQRDGGCLAASGELVLRFDGESCPGFDIGAFRDGGAP